MFLFSNRFLGGPGVFGRLILGLDVLGDFNQVGRVQTFARLRLIGRIRYCSWLY
jgi:hypothetical protein